MFAIGPQRTRALALHMSAFIQMRTYTEIYARISADPPPSGAIIFGMWKKIGTATMTTTAITAWFAVVALGLVGQLWPLLEGVP